MSRCRSWRPREGTPHPAGHQPGKCRICWRPCFRPSPDGSDICPACLYELAEHPDAEVRAALLDTDPPADVVELLSTDLDPAVQRAAAFRLKDATNRSFPWSITPP